MKLTFSYLKRQPTGKACSSFLLCALLLILPLDAAQAHSGQRGFILLLPTHLYLIGGALVVVLSFAVMALVPNAALAKLERARWRLGTLPNGGEIPSLLTLAFFLVLLAAGYHGSRDPLANPLPLAVWSLWWIGFTFLQALLGDLWAALNPWRGLYRLLTALPGLRRWRQAPPLTLPAWLGCWPAVLWFLAFAWLELVYPAPQDPARLADAVALYFGATLVCMLLFGGSTWLQRGEAFSVFFRMVSWLAPLGRRKAQDGRALDLTLPGLRLLDLGVLPLSTTAFVLLALASVSFDGLMRSFWWLDLVGVNPLAYPGRTDLVHANSLGLPAAFAALSAAYLLAVLLGRNLGALQGSRRENLGRFVVAIVPIAFGYHFAHYLPAFLVEAQYGLRALSDPFALGWDLLGTRDLPIVTSFLAHHRSVEVIWNLQVAAIVGAHVAAVAVAHCLALQHSTSRRAALMSQIPMTVLMVAYTLFGLWLLSTPAVG